MYKILTIEEAKSIGFDNFDQKENTARRSTDGYVIVSSVNITDGLTKDQILEIINNNPLWEDVV